MSESASYRLLVPNNQIHSQSVSLMDLQSEIEQKDEIIRSLNQLENKRILDLGRSRCEADDYEFQKNVLREECQLLAKLNEDLRELIEEKSRELEKREKEHSVDLANFKKLCDEMVRNISEEKNRALSKLTRELKEKEIEYQVRVKKSPSPFSSDELHPTEPNTAATGLTENLDEKSAHRHKKDSSLSEDGIREEITIVQKRGGEREKAAYQDEGESIEFSKERSEQFEAQEKEIQILRIKIHEAEIERETLVEKFKQQEDERVQRYEAKIKQLEENVKTLEKAALAQSEEQKKLQLEVSKAESLKTEAVSLKEEVSAKEKEAEGYRTEANILRDEVEMLKSNIENLKEVISLKEKEIEISQFELKAAKRNSVKSSEASPEKIKEEDDEAEKELERLKEYVAGFEAKLKAEEEKYQEMHKKYQKALQEEHDLNIAKIEERANKQKEKKKEYKNKWNEIQTELSNREMEKAEISIKVLELEESITKYSEKEEEHNKTLQEANKKKEELTKQIETLNQKIKELQTDLDNLKNSQERNQKAHQKQIEQLKEGEQTIKNELEGKVEEYRNTIERLEKGLKEAQEKARGADKEKEELTQKIQELEKELAKAVEAKNKLEGSLAEVTRKLEEAISEKEGAEKRIKNLEKKVSKGKGKSGEQQQTVEDSSELIEELKRAREEIQTKDHEIELLKKELQEKIGIIEEKEKSIKALKMKIGIMNEQVDESERGAKDFESLRKTLKEISERLDVTAKQDTSPKALTAIFVEVKDKLIQIESKFDSEKNKETNLRKKLDKAQSELALARDNNENYLKALDESRRESEQKIEKLEKINAELELQLRLHQGKMVHTEQEHVQIRGSYEKALQTLEFEKEGLKKEAEGHKRTLSNMTKEKGTANEALTLRVDELENEKKQLEQELWHVKTDASNFVREIEFLKMELQRSHEFFQNEQMKLEGKLKEEQEEVRRAREAAKAAAAEAVKAREEWIAKEYGNVSPVRDIHVSNEGGFVTREREVESASNDGWVTREHEVEKVRQIIEPASQKKEERRKIARNIPRFDDVEYIDDNVPQQKEEAPVSQGNEDGWTTRETGTTGDGWVTRETEIVKTRIIPDQGPRKREDLNKKESVVVDNEGYATRITDEGFMRESVQEKEKVARVEERVRRPKNLPCWDGEGEETYIQERVIEREQTGTGEKSKRGNLRYAQIPQEEPVRGDQEEKVSAAQEEINRLHYELRQVVEDREQLRKKLMEIDSYYSQKLDEMAQELFKKDEHIKALMFDVSQMKEWIVEHHGEDVFEKEDGHHLHPHAHHHHEESNIRSGRDSAVLSVNESKDEMSKSMTITIPSEPVNDEWAGIQGILKSPERKEEKKKKQKQNFSLSWKGQKGTEIVTVHVPENKKKGERLNASASGRYLVSYSNSATPKSHKNSERGSVGTSDSKKDKKPEAAYQQLERMILELNEKLLNADKKAKEDYTSKIEEVNLEAAAREARLVEEIDKIKEEKAVLEKQMEELKWEHAYEIKKLLGQTDEKGASGGASQESTPVNNPEKKDGEGKKKKKKKK